MANKGFTLPRDSALTFTELLLDAKTIFNRYSTSIMDARQGKFILHDFINTSNIAELEFTAPLRKKSRGFEYVLSALQYTDFSPKSIDYSCVKQLMSNKHRIRRVMCFPTGPMIVDSGDLFWQVRFPEADMRDTLYTETLQEKLSERRHGSLKLGPLNFKSCEDRLLESKAAMRVCVNLQGAWIETRDDRHVPSVRFDFFGKQLIPLKRVESSEITLYQIDRENELYSIDIVRKNHCMIVKQTFNAYHYFLEHRSNLKG